MTGGNTAARRRSRRARRARRSLCLRRVVVDVVKLYVMTPQCRHTRTVSSERGSCSLLVVSVSGRSLQSHSCSKRWDTVFGCRRSRRD